jgi:hypothetical protein
MVLHRKRIISTASDGVVQQLATTFDHWASYDPSNTQFVLWTWEPGVVFAHPFVNGPQNPFLQGSERRISIKIEAVAAAQWHLSQTQARLDPTQVFSRDLACFRVASALRQRTMKLACGQGRENIATHNRRRRREARQRWRFAREQECLKWGVASWRLTGNKNSNRNGVGSDQFFIYFIIILEMAVPSIRVKLTITVQRFLHWGLLNVTHIL